jgi:ABC-type multidrug transport system permease subunit
MTDDKAKPLAANAVGEIDASAVKSAAEARGRGNETAKRQTMHPLVELTLTRVREFVREPEVIFWVFIFPVLMACALGIAFRNTPPEKIRIAVEENGKSVAVAQVVAALEQSGDVLPVVLSEEEGARALRTGSVALVVRVAGSQISDPRSQNSDPKSQNSDPRSQVLDPRSLSENEKPGSQNVFPPLVYRYDPTRPESRTAKLAVDNALWRVKGTVDGLNARDETVAEVGARYIDFLIPGLIGLNLMGSGMWGLGFAIVSARGKKLLKRFAATPMRRSHYLLSFMLSRLLFLALEVAALVAFARLVFGVVVRGSLIDVAVCAVVGALAFSGLGLLVAARPRTVEGVSGLMNFVMLPMWLLSGTFFSAARFPQWFQPFIRALPLTALNDVMRAVMNDGVPLVSHWNQLAIVMAWGLLSFLVALRIFRWQ